MESISIFTAVFASPVGKLGIVTDDGKIVKIAFLSSDHYLIAAKNALAKVARQQLEAYFASSQHRFSLPIQLNGTPLQQKIWRAFKEIPLGNTITYGEMAAKFNTSPRVVGNACRANPLPIIIPCHRIVAKNGLGGFSGKRSGFSLVMKAWLLRHEQVIMD